MLRCQKFSYLLVGVLMGILVSFSFAYANSNIVRLIVDGEDITYSSDVPPQIINGRTLIPARILSEKLGATVGWDNDSKTVIVTSKENNIVKDKDIELNTIKKTTYKGLPAIDVNGKTYFWLRPYAIEIHNKYDTVYGHDKNNSVSWDEENQSFIITLKAKQTIIPNTPENVQRWAGDSYINTIFYQDY